MKIKMLLITLMLSTTILHAQEQVGVVKTVGRPGQAGTPIEGVTVRAKGSTAVSVSDDSGTFMITLAHYTAGQAYSLVKIQKEGYQLADNGVVGRLFPYSADIPLEISMISREDYNRTKNEIEAQIRSRMAKEYQDQLDTLNKQLEEKTISEELLQQRHLDLLDYYDNIEHLVEELADRYARTDYDYLDTLDQQINHLIEQGLLEEAEALIDSKETEKELEMIKASNTALEKALADGKLAESRKIAEYAQELQKRYEIAAMRFDNSSAAGFLKKRMELDPSNIEWKMQYASFIREYLENYNEAMTIYQELLATASETDLIAKLFFNLGSVHNDLAQNEKAIEYYEKAHEIWLETYGEGHYTDAHYHNGTAIALYALGRKEEALVHLGKALQITIGYYGEMHQNTGNAYYNLAVHYTDRKEYEKALNTLEKACNIYNKTLLSAEHPTFADTYNQIGIVYLHIKDYDKAEIYFNKALKIYLKVYGDKHSDVALIYHNQSVIHQMRGEYTAAAEKLDKAYRIFSKIYGKEHTKVATTLAEIGQLYNITGNYDKAIEYIQKAVEIAEKLYPKGHEIRLAYKSGLADIYFKAEQYVNAMTYEISAFNESMEHYGLDKGFTGIFFKNLMKMYIKLLYSSSYNGEFAEEMAQLNANTMITATVVKNSQAEQMGLSGTYQVIKFEAWSASETQTDFFRYHLSVADRQQKTYFLYRDGEFVKFPFEGIAGINLNAVLISAEEKQEILKEFKKWYRKNK